MSESLKESILSRGYWEIKIRPMRFGINRIPKIADLYPLLQKTFVSLRGWDFPHVGHKSEFLIGEDWIKHEFDWQHHRSILYFFQSGQFYYLEALPEDWRDKSTLWPKHEMWEPGQLLGVGETIFRFTEIFEFVSRLVLTGIYENAVKLDVKLGNIENRQLYVDTKNKWPFDYARKTAMPNLVYKSELKKEELVSNTKALAIKASIYLFERFGWDATEEIVGDWQEKALRF